MTTISFKGKSLLVTVDDDDFTESVDYNTPRVRVQVQSMFLGDAGREDRVHVVGFIRAALAASGTEPTCDSGFCGNGFHIHDCPASGPNTPESFAELYGISKYKHDLATCPECAKPAIVDWERILAAGVAAYAAEVGKYGYVGQHDKALDAALRAMFALLPALVENAPILTEEWLGLPESGSQYGSAFTRSIVQAKDEALNWDGQSHMLGFRHGILAARAKDALSRDAMDVWRSHQDVGCHVCDGDNQEDRDLFIHGFNAAREEMQRES